MNTDVEQVRQLIYQISALLKGHDSGIQGAVLCDLLAIWLAGHRIDGDPAETTRLHESMLEIHMASCRQLIPLNTKHD